MFRKVVLFGLLLILLLSLTSTFNVHLTAGIGLSNDLSADVLSISDDNSWVHWEATLHSLSSIGLTCNRLPYNASGSSYSLFGNRTTEDLDLLLHYPLVILEKRMGNGSILLNAKEHSTLQSYLTAGGNLLVTGVDSLGNPDDQLLANIVRSKTTGDDIGQPDLYISNSTHPIMNGTYGSFPTAYHIRGLPDNQDRAQADTNRGGVSVARLADGYDKIIATQTSGGRVVYWNGDGIDDWSYFDPNCTAIFKNAIKWLYPGLEHDLVAKLQIPTDLPTDLWGYLQMEPGWTRVINATVYNRGRSAETNVALQLWFNDTIVASASIPELRSGTSYTLGYLWTATSATESFIITAKAPQLTTENMIRNNIFNATVRVLASGPEFHIYPALETFGTFPSNFTTTVRIFNATDMYGYQLSLGYDPFILNITNVWFGPDFVFNYTEYRLTCATPSSEGEGSIAIMGCLVGKMRTFSGDGILCHLEGTVLHSGQSILQIYSGVVLDSEGQAAGAMYSYPSGSVDVKLQAGHGFVTITPSYQVESWNFTSQPNTLDFNLSTTGGRCGCSVSIPLDIMHGPFGIFIDGDFAGRNGYSVEFNSTHATLILSCDLADGVHNIQVIEGALMNPWGDINGDGQVNIADIFIVAKHFGEKLNP